MSNIFKIDVVSLMTIYLLLQHINQIRVAPLPLHWEHNEKQHKRPLFEQF